MPIHADSIDLLVTAALALIEHPDTTPEAQVIVADGTGLTLSAALAADGDGGGYRWQPIAEILTAELVDELLPQIERTRLAYIDAAHQVPGWVDSPARRFIDLLGTEVRARLDRGTMNPNVGILTSAELEETAADWRRPTIHASSNLTDPEGDPHGQP
ncbi:hypothetical protein [Microbacterium xylanilyticum]